LLYLGEVVCDEAVEVSGAVSQHGDRDALEQVVQSFWNVCRLRLTRRRAGRTTVT